MPKTGMEAVRRAGLVQAAIEEIGHSGTFDVTVSQIARRAGVSSALAHHYFGTKEQIFLSAIRGILTLYGEEVRQELRSAANPKQRIEAVIRASFAQSNFRPEVVGAWLSFYVRAQNSAETLRLLNVYKKRLRSNLLTGLKPLVGDDAERIAEGIAAMIDGLYVRQSLSRDTPSGTDAVAMVVDYLERQLDRAPAPTA